LCGSTLPEGNPQTDGPNGVPAVKSTYPNGRPAASRSDDIDSDKSNGKTRTAFNPQLSTGQPRLSDIKSVAMVGGAPTRKASDPVERFSKRLRAQLN